MLNSETQLELLEQMFKLPPEEREAFLNKAVKDKKAVYLGSTDKSAPELATEFIKKGVRAKSYVKGGDKIHAKRAE